MKTIDNHAHIIPPFGFVTSTSLTQRLRGMRHEPAAPVEQPSTPEPARPKMAVETTVVTKLAVSRKEAAELLSVSVRTFDRWVASGLIHASGVGHRKIFAVTELQRFLQETSETIAI